MKLHYSLKIIQTRTECEKYLSYSADMSKQDSSKGELSNQFFCNKYSNMNDRFQSTVHLYASIWVSLKPTDEEMQIKGKSYEQ